MDALWRLLFRGFVEKPEPDYSDSDLWWEPDELLTHTDAPATVDVLDGLGLGVPPKLARAYVTLDLPHKLNAKED